MNLDKYKYNKITRRVDCMKDMTYYTYTYNTNNEYNNCIISNIKIKAPSKNGSIVELEIKALWDTGATNSGITKDLVDKYNLIAFDKEEVSFGIGHKAVERIPMSVYLGEMPYPFDIMAICIDPSQDYQAVIGMDIIMRGDLHLVHENGNIILKLDCPVFN